MNLGVGGTEMGKVHSRIGLLVAILLFVSLAAMGCGTAASPPPTSAPATPTSVPESKPQATAPAKPVASPTMPAVPVASPTAAAQAQQLNPPVNVKVGVVGSVSDAGIFIGVEKGYFKDEGLNVELVSFTSAANMIAPLGTGQLDIGAGAPGAGLYNAIARDIPLKITADKGRNSPGFSFAALIARKDLVESGQLKDYRDLKGRKIALNVRGAGPDIQLEKALKKGGLGLGDVDIQVMPFPDMGTAIANKAVDVALTIEPFIAVGVQKGLFVRWKGVDDFYPGDQASVILYSPAFAKSQIEGAKRWMVGYVRALRLYNDAFTKNDRQAKQDVVSILTKHTTVKDAALYDQMVPADITPEGYANADDLIFKQDWFAAQGSVKEKADLKAAIDNQYVDYANQRLGKYK